ncbi:MAG: hypothetical protein JJ845_006305 [Prochlorococcus marinus CUG1436]|nr:hypothetical protein [Prochlorococcus marinus CUG1436]
MTTRPSPVPWYDSNCALKEGERKSSDCYQIIISVFLAACLAFTNRNEDLMFF